MSKIHYLIFLVLLVTACGGTKKPKAINSHQKSASVVLKAAFNADSAYHFVDEQVAFGPRVPGTDAHKLCAQYFEDKLSNYGAQVTVQAFSAKGFDGHIWEGKNIIASFQAGAQDRIMLCAHWDSRFIAEADKDSTKQKQAIDGANDGASGVGVLLEIARQLQIKAPNVGVDIIFFDVEDQGAPSHLANAGTEHSWCLGSQHWANEAASMNYKARWGILLDMVGAPDAVFYKDQISMHYAGELVDYVWNKAASLGYTDYFINQRGGGLTDDHLYVNQIAGIPCIDIIDYDNHRGFNSTWHTHDDNMGNIDKNTLYMVGDVVLEIIYEQ
jgi:glutaminyl-peptide cyclotransferase